MIEVKILLGIILQVLEVILIMVVTSTDIWRAILLSIALSFYNSCLRALNGE